MLDRVTADEIVRNATSGRTRPIVMVCEAETETPVEVFCKLSVGCDEGVTSLAREVVAACLAADLGLPVPTPYLVELPAALSASITDADAASRLQGSSNIGFGSAKVSNQFSAWTSGHRVSDAMLTDALSALLFDAVIANPDRRMSNPNCLVSGDRIRLIDHELSFPPTSMLIGWQPSWQVGGLNWMDQPDGHIFCKALKKRNLDFSSFPGVWSGLSDARLQQYRASIPSEWSSALPAIDDALEQVRNSRDNIHGVIAEIGRLLK